MGRGERLAEELSRLDAIALRLVDPADGGAVDRDRHRQSLFARVVEAPLVAAERLVALAELVRPPGREGSTFAPSPVRSRSTRRGLALPRSALAPARSSRTARCTLPISTRPHASPRVSPTSRNKPQARHALRQRLLEVAEAGVDDAQRVPGGRLAALVLELVERLRSLCGQPVRLVERAVEEVLIADRSRRQRLAQRVETRAGQRERLRARAPSSARARGARSPRPPRSARRSARGT